MKVILGEEDPLTMWDRVIEQMREDGIEDYIQRQNDQYWLSLSPANKGEK